MPLAALLVLALTAGLGPSTAAFAEWQELAAVQRTAETFVREHLRDTPGKVDVKAGTPENRLRLPRCEQMAAFTPPGARYWGNATVGIRCNAPSAWTLYLPVTVHVIGEMVVTARAIQRGQIVGAGDVSLQESDLTQVAVGSVTQLERVIGRVAKSNLPGGTAIREDQLRPLPLIGMGDPVRLAFAGDGFEVISSGRAMSAGGLGESIDVKASSGRLLKGIVLGKGQVSVQ